MQGGRSKQQQQCMRCCSVPQPVFKLPRVPPLRPRRLVSFNVFTIGERSHSFACVAPSNMPRCTLAGAPLACSRCHVTAEAVNFGCVPCCSPLSPAAFQGEDLSQRLRELLKDTRGRVTVAFELLALVSCGGDGSSRSLAQGRTHCHPAPSCAPSCAHRLHVDLQLLAPGCTAPIPLRPKRRWAWPPSCCWSWALSLPTASPPGWTFGMGWTC